MGVHPQYELFRDGQETDDTAQAEDVSLVHPCNTSISPTDIIESTTSVGYSKKIEISVTGELTVAVVKGALGLTGSEEWTFSVSTPVKVEVPIGRCAKLLCKPIYTVLHGKLLRWYCDGSKVTKGTYSVRIVDHFMAWGEPCYN